MDEQRKRKLFTLLDGAYAIPDDELRDSDKPVEPGIEPSGELDRMEKQIYTFILRKLDALAMLTAKTKAVRENGLMDDRMREHLLTEAAKLTEEQMLANEYLGFRVHKRLGIDKKAGIGIRQGWRVVEVPARPRPSVSVILIEGPPPDGDPTDWN